MRVEPVKNRHELPRVGECHRSARAASMPGGTGTNSGAAPAVSNPAMPPAWLPGVPLVKAVE